MSMSDQERAFRNASEASEPVAWLVQKSDGTGWYLTSDANEAQHMHENRLLQVQPLYAAPPSDRAAVEGVSEAELKAAFDVLRKHRVVVANVPWEAMREAIAAARASDTNAAAAPVGQAVDLVFDDFPGPQWPRFIEAEDSNGKSICVGEWLRREDGYVVLRMNASSPPTPRDAYRQPTIEDAREVCARYDVNSSVVLPSDAKLMLAALNSIKAVIAEDVQK